MEKMQLRKIRQLVKQARLGDEEAFSRLYSETVKAQYFTALSILKDNLLAEDVIQLTYLQVYQNLPRLSTPATFLSWLSRITYNNCIDALKKKQRLAPELTADMPVEIMDESYGADPLQSAQLTENQHLLMEILNNISPEHRIVIILRYLQHLSVKEIADITNTSEGTVRSRIHYALLKLKKQLNNKGFYGTDSLINAGFIISRVYERPESFKLKKGGASKGVLASFLLAGIILTAGAAAAVPTIKAADDRKPPVVETVQKLENGFLITIKDTETGIDFSSLSAVQDNSSLRIRINDRSKGLIFIKTNKNHDLILTAADQAGNEKKYLLTVEEKYSFDFDY